MIRPREKFERNLADISHLLGTSHLEQNPQITGITNQSGDVEPGDIFLAFKGAKSHGATFANEAKERGARAILTDHVGATLAEYLDLPIIEVTNPRWSAGILSSWFFGEPMRDMHSVGITGTNGKTTTTTLLAQIWELAGRETGLIGTVETRIGKEQFESSRTTPESPELQSLIATMRERHVTNLAMEVSSHAIALDRLRGSHFSAVGFTNLTQDHLDFHLTMDDYFKTKSKLFEFEYADSAFINIDSSYGQNLASSTQLPVTSIARSMHSADWYYESVNRISLGYEVVIRGQGGISIQGTLPLPGDYNLDNALMAIAFAYESGVDPLLISSVLPALQSAPGRLDPVSLGQPFFAFVDYAHSPDAVQRVLHSCRALSEGRIIAVLGCGGDRDAGKRPLMGNALFQGSDIAIFTSDNPRSEDPAVILREMVGNHKIYSPNAVILDRREAIDYAVKLAEPKDVVLILGKGHEQGQEISGVVHPFDDRLILAKSIETHA